MKKIDEEKNDQCWIIIDSDVEKGEQCPNRATEFKWLSHWDIGRVQTRYPVCSYHGESGIPTDMDILRIAESHLKQAIERMADLSENTKELSSFISIRRDFETINARFNLLKKMVRARSFDTPVS